MTVKQPNIQTLTIPLRVTNSQDTPITLHLEPWGEEWSLAPRCSLDLQFEGPPGHGPEAEYGRDAISVYGWPGSTVQVVRTLNGPTEHTEPR